LVKEFFSFFQVSTIKYDDQTIDYNSDKEVKKTDGPHGKLVIDLSEQM
jgi:hypothetical protein